MLFSFAIVSSFLFASVVLADRYLENHQSRLHKRLEQFAGATSDGVLYSYNWAGAVWQKDNGTFTSVTGDFTVPVASGQNGSAASVWVGIDGDTCHDVILQTGVDFVVINDTATYRAWYEWYPEYDYFRDLSISAGDNIRVNVTALSTTSGIAIVENLTNGQSAHKYLHSTLPLCGQNAEWIVQDFLQDGKQAPLANFGSVTITDAAATGPGIIYTPDGATIVEMQQNKTLTSVSISGSRVTIEYL
ncbi:hypothetical protein OG21DRAFT_1506320 [Imleria badia]|nr:hypothetical protein OG21DRAFT_1506320 [Imleria badia]